MNQQNAMNRSQNDRGNLNNKINSNQNSNNNNNNTNQNSILDIFGLKQTFENFFDKITGNSQQSQ